ncbi:MAG: hypothetical protein ACTSX9_06530 [Candidatus Njordarchaeales archaeon]
MRRALVILLLFWALSATFFAFYFYDMATRLQRTYSHEIIYVDIGINYGNGTLIWCNNTKVLRGTSAFEALLIVADSVNATIGAYGVYVRGINGVNEYDSVAWLYAIYNREVPVWQRVGKWIYPSISADQLILKENDVVVWVFLNWALYGNNLPIPTSTENLRG